MHYRESNDSTYASHLVEVDESSIWQLTAVKTNHVRARYASFKNSSFSCLCVCVCFPKNREKGGDERENAPKRGGKGQKGGGWSLKNAHSCWGPWMALPIHIPSIWALDPIMWSTIPLSLACVPAVLTLIVCFKGISYPF